MRKQQLLLVVILASFFLAAQNYTNVLNFAAADIYQQSNLALSDTFVMSQAVTLNQPVTGGNLVVVAVSAYASNTANIATVTDNFGNRYFKAIANPVAPAGKHSVSIWYAANVTGGANFVVTATAEKEAAYITLAAHEYSGLEINGTLDQVSGSSGLGTAASSGTTPQTSQGEELIFGAFLHQEAGIVNASSGPGFILRQSEKNGTYEPLFTEDRLEQAQGSFDSSLNWDSPANWSGVVATFKLKSTLPANPAATPTAQPAPTPTQAATAPTPTVTAGSGQNPGGIQTAVPVGPGGSDNIPHQIIRTAADRVYIFGYQGQRSVTVKAYWTTDPGLPSTNSSWNSTQVTEGELPLSVEPVYDGNNIIHVLMNTNKGNLKDYIFDTTTNSFKGSYIIAGGNPTVAGDYVGTSGLSAMMDRQGLVHVAYWSGGNHISYLAFSFEPASGALTMRDGPTQLDTTGSTNHPALAISPVDGSITVAWVAESAPVRIEARTRQGGSWGAVERVSAASPWTSTIGGINIDQGPSLVIDSGGERQLGYIENYDSTGDYGRVHYVTKGGSGGWQDSGLGVYTHDPALGINSGGEVYIIGHGHANNRSCTSNLDMCVTKKNPDGTWANPEIFATHTTNNSFDTSPSVKWSAVGFNRPETIEFIFPLALNANYADTVLYYGSIAASVTPPPTNTPVPTPTATPPPPLVVTNIADNGDITLGGTLSYALDKAISGQTISFNLTSGSTVTITGKIPAVKQGVRLRYMDNNPRASCQSPITLDAETTPGGANLELSGQNKIEGLIIRTFPPGPGIRSIGTNNSIICTIVSF